MLSKKAFIYLFFILSVYFINNFVFSKDNFCTLNKNGGGLFFLKDEIKSIGFILDDGSININSNTFNGNLSNYNFLGDVIVQKDDLILNSDYININKGVGGRVINIPGDFLFKNINILLKANSLLYNLDSKSGLAKNFIFRVYGDSNHNFQGQGERIDILDNDNYRLYGTKANTCLPNDDSWYIKSKEIRVDKLNNIWIAKDAKLFLGGVPILFLPWMDFPLNGNRKSGFLAPSIGVSNDNGLEVSLPYYFNLAPNYDITISPYLYYRRGISFINEFRYLERNYFGDITFQILPHDKISSKQELLNYRSTRYILNLHNSIFFSDNLKFNIDYNKASDNYFYRDLGNKQNSVENTYLNQQVSFSYDKKLYGGYLRAVLMAQKYQILQDENNNIEEIYDTIPQLTINYTRDFLRHGEFELFSQFSRFRHDDKQSGTRQLIYPFFRWNYENEWFIFRPKLGLHATFYQIDSFTNLLEHKDSYNRTRVLPIFSLESGLIFERGFNFFNRGYIQTLEPKLFYAYIPNRNQNDLPNFDSSENDFNYAQLFKENRFSGNDRINSANHLSLALMSRVYSKSNGIERFRLGLGQRFYFHKDSVSIYNVADDFNKHKSDTIFFARGYINKDLYFFSDIHYDNNYHLTSSYTNGFTYNPKIGKIISLRFKHDNNTYGIFRGEDISSNQVDISGQWPIRSNYYLLAKHNYSFRGKKTLENILGIEYKAKCGCWGANFVLQRYLTDYNTHKKAVFFRLFLRGLGGIGSNPVDELKRSMPNYVPVSEVK